MISLEQVQLLESKVAKAIEYIQKVDSENAALYEERTALQSKLDSTQKRLDEVEMLVMRFKEDQGRIEDGILAALGRLSQFEEAFETSLTADSMKNAKRPSPRKEKPDETAAKKEQKQEFFEIDKEESEIVSGELDIF